MPLPDPTVAIAVEPEVQVPPVEISLSVVVSPAQTTDVPVMDAGAGFTVTTLVAVQPVGSAYVILAVPEVMPETTPLEEPIDAIDVLSLAQVPAPASVKVVAAPSQTTAAPAIAEGSGLTVTIIVALHPVDKL
jgi:hypothetical protein